MNEYFSYPDKIRIDRAVFYKIAPIPLDVPFKDGTGNVRNASLFGSWMKIYDEDGVCGATYAADAEFFCAHAS